MAVQMRSSFQIQELLLNASGNHSITSLQTPQTATIITELTVTANRPLADVQQLKFKHAL
jgi:hypothetical protein